MDQSPHINYFAQTDFRGRKIPFGIKSEDRAKHMYIIGKTGMGKSTMLENMAIQDIKNGEGVCFIDPHGKTAELLLSYVPKERINDVLYIAPFDLEYPIGFNVMEDVGKDERHLVAAGLMSAFKKIWVDAWSARMEYILNNTILALLEYPDSTLLSVNKMLSDKKFREKVVGYITDPGVKSFWVDEFAGYTERFTAEATPAIQNKVGQFTSNPLIRNILGQPKSTFNFRQLMDEKKIVIINLSKGRIGEGNANLLGSMLITKIYLAAMSRANISEGDIKKLPPFYLYVDEFQSFANESFADILSEARKYKLALTIAHQYIEQMPEEVRDAVFGNVGTTIAFRVGPFDAEVFEKIFFPTFIQEDLVNLSFAQIYLTLSIDGVGSKPFSAVTLPPIVPLDKTYANEVIASSRKKYARPFSEVEKIILALHNDNTNSNSQSSGQSNQKNNFNDNSGNNKKIGSSNPVNPRNDVDYKSKTQTQTLTPTNDRPFSLLNLKRKEPREDTKSTGKHKNDLRSALADLMTNNQREDVSKNKIDRSSIPDIEKPNQSSKTNSGAILPSNEKKSEVPENILRDILKVHDK